MESALPNASPATEDASLSDDSDVPPQSAMTKETFSDETESAQSSDTSDAPPQSPTTIEHPPNTAIKTGGADLSDKSGATLSEGSGSELSEVSGSELSDDTGAELSGDTDAQLSDDSDASVSDNTEAPSQHAVTEPSYTDLQSEGASLPENSHNSNQPVAGNQKSSASLSLTENTQISGDSDVPPQSHPTVEHSSNAAPDDSDAQQSDSTDAQQSDDSEAHQSESSNDELSDDSDASMADDSDASMSDVSDTPGPPAAGDPANANLRSENVPASETSDLLDQSVMETEEPSNSASVTVDTQSSRNFSASPRPPMRNEHPQDTASETEDAPLSDESDAPGHTEASSLPNNSGTAGLPLTVNETPLNAESETEDAPLSEESDSPALPVLRNMKPATAAPAKRALAERPPDPEPVPKKKYTKSYRRYVNVYNTHVKSVFALDYLDDTPAALEKQLEPSKVTLAGAHYFSDNPLDFASPDEMDPRDKPDSEVVYNGIAPLSEIHSVPGCFWTPKEKNIFFNCLARYTIHRASDIAKHLPQKLLVDIWVYYLLLKRLLHAMKRPYIVNTSQDDEALVFKAVKGGQSYAGLPIAFEVDGVWMEHEEKQSVMMLKHEPLLAFNRYVFRPAEMDSYRAAPTPETPDEEDQPKVVEGLIDYNVAHELARIYQGNRITPKLAHQNRGNLTFESLVLLDELVRLKTRQLYAALVQNPKFNGDVQVQREVTREDVWAATESLRLFETPASGHRSKYRHGKSPVLEMYWYNLRKSLQLKVFVDFTEIFETEGTGWRLFKRAMDYQSDDLLLMERNFMDPLRAEEDFQRHLNDYQVFPATVHLPESRQRVTRSGATQVTSQNKASSARAGTETPRSPGLFDLTSDGSDNEFMPTSDSDSDIGAFARPPKQTKLKEPFSFGERKAKSADPSIHGNPDAAGSSHLHSEPATRSEVEELHPECRCGVAGKAGSKPGPHTTPSSYNTADDDEVCMLPYCTRTESSLGKAVFKYETKLLEGIDREARHALLHNLKLKGGVRRNAVIKKVSFKTVDAVWDKTFALYDDRSDW